MQSSTLIAVLLENSTRQIFRVADVQAARQFASQHLEMESIDSE